MKIKIKSYKIREAGSYTAIALPKIWLEDTGLVTGDMVDVFRDDEDRLILVPCKQDKKEAEILK